MSKLEKIINILTTKFISVYCDTCMFYGMNEDDADEKYGYYGCDNCHRKCMEWGLSKRSAEELAKGILMVIDGDNVFNDKA